MKKFLYLFLLGAFIALTACSNEPGGSSDAKGAQADSTATTP